MDEDLRRFLRGHGVGGESLGCQELLPVTPLPDLDAITGWRERLEALGLVRMRLFLHLAANGCDFIHSDADAFWPYQPGMSMTFAPVRMCRLTWRVAFAESVKMSSTLRWPQIGWTHAPSEPRPILRTMPVEMFAALPVLGAFGSRVAVLHDPNTCDK